MTIATSLLALLKENEKVKRVLSEVSWDLGKVHPCCYKGAPDCEICAIVQRIRNAGVKGTDWIDTSNGTR